MTYHVNKMATLSKADYLKRYMSNDDDSKKRKEKRAKKKHPKTTGRGMTIFDDDVDWKQLVANNEEKENKDEDDEEAPVIAEVIDERPEEVKQLEVFRTSNKWKVMGASDDEFQEPQDMYFTASLKGQQAKTDKGNRKIRHDSPESSTLRQVRHDSPDLSPPRQRADARARRHDSSSPSPPRKSTNSSPSRTQKQHCKGGRFQDADLSPPKKRPQTGRGSDSDQSPPRRRPRVRQGSDSDLSPPRKSHTNKGSDSDLSPPRKRGQGGRGSDSDLSPPRRGRSPATQTMLSGGAAGLVSVEILRREQEELRRREKHNQPLEEESRNAQTVFRDKSGKKRDLETEREEQSRKAGEKAEKDQKYAQWGKGLAQGQMQQQNTADALKEAQKPLARHIDDEDLDKLLREQERDGDPMAALLRKKREKNAKLKGVKERPRYKGPPPPPNRFNIMPGFRWDGVDRSNGFEQKRYSRMADKKAVQEVAYKWSVEDM